MKRACILALATALLGAGPARAQELGRLFFTPEQRAALDARRKARLPDRPTVQRESPTTRVDGYVARSSGRSTMWVDGEPLADGAQPEGLRVQRAREAGRVNVTFGEQSRRIELRVGETLDRSTGDVKGLVGNGEVRVEHRGAQPR
jgi:hypothetical protein